VSAPVSPARQPILVLALLRIHCSALGLVLGLAFRDDSTSITPAFLSTNKF